MCSADPYENAVVEITTSVNANDDSLLDGHDHRLARCSHSAHEDSAEPKEMTQWRVQQVRLERQQR